jgi:hypothetical protein
MKYILKYLKTKQNLLKIFFKSISFVKSFKEVDAKEITNKKILKSINDYETKKKKPTPLSLDELKKMINA